LKNQEDDQKPLRTVNGAWTAGREHPSVALIGVYAKARKRVNHSADLTGDEKPQWPCS